MAAMLVDKTKSSVNQHGSATPLCLVSPGIGCKPPTLVTHKSKIQTGQLFSAVINIKMKVDQK